MSYATHALSGPPITVGAQAQTDPVLAEASRVAAEIVLAMAKTDPAARMGVMLRRLDALNLGPGLGQTVIENLRKLLVAGKFRDQAVFDAMRAAIANRTMARGLREMRDAIFTIKTQQGRDVYEAGLGQIAPSDRQAACLAAGIGGTVGGALQVIPVYGTIIGGILGIAGGATGAALDCGADQRAAAQRMAASQAAAAQAALAQAQALEAARQAEQSRRMKQYVLIGGGALILGGIAYLALS